MDTQKRGLPLYVKLLSGFGLIVLIFLILSGYAILRLETIMEYFQKTYADAVLINIVVSAEGGRDECDQVAPWLRQQVGDPAEVDGLIKLGAGRPLRALRATAAVIREELLVFDRVLNALSENHMSPVQAAEELVALAPLDFIEYLLNRHCREIRGGFLDSRLPNPSVFVYLDQLLSAKRMVMSKANPNAQLLAEELLMGWQQARSITRP